MRESGHFSHLDKYLPETLPPLLYLTVDIVQYHFTCANGDVIETTVYVTYISLSLQRTTAHMRRIAGNHPQYAIDQKEVSVVLSASPAFPWHVPIKTT